MAEVPLPTPTQVPVPSTDIRNAVFAGAKLDEEVTGTGEFYTDRLGVKRLTNTGRNNQFNAAQQDRESRFNSFIQSSGYEVVGDYTAGPLTLTEYNQLIRYNNELYKLTAATDIPYTTAGTTDETWNATDSLHFVSVGDAALRQNLGSDEGLKLVGQCAHLNALRAAEPSFSGQQIYLESLYGGWAATAAGMPWGGGKLRHIASLPEALRIDDGGCIFKTAAGNCWVREELLTGQGEIRVEWYLSGGATLVDDGSDYLQAALDTGRLWSQYSDRNKTVRIVMPSLLRITRTITAYTRGVRIDGNHGL
ncbi:TPA: hypothetical protein ACP475_003618, partial [Klebsiella pneumoniae]